MALTCKYLIRIKLGSVDSVKRTAANRQTFTARLLGYTRWLGHEDCEAR